MAWFQKKSTVSPDYTCVQIQTSSSMMPVPWAMGTNRCTPNIIYVNDFESHAEKSGGKGGSCFIGSTLVSTPNGRKRIDSLKTNDDIWCVDPKTGDKLVGKVIGVLKHDRESSDFSKLLELTHERGKLRGVTANHWLWDDSRSNQKEAGSYYPGDELYHERYGVIKVTAIREIPEQEFTYNLVVGPYHNFFADGILVHNGGGGKTSGYTYSATMILALACNPYHGDSYAVNTIYDNNSTYSMSGKGFNLGSGVDEMLGWTYLTEHHPDDVLDYEDIIVAYASGHDMGSSATPGTEQFELIGPGKYSGSNGDAYQIHDDEIGDASAPTILYSLFWYPFGLNLPEFIRENVDDLSWRSPGCWGYAGNDLHMSGMDLDDLKLHNYSWDNYCRALGLDFSVLITSQEDARSIIDRLGQFTNTAIYWSGSVYKAMPYATEQVSGNGFTFYPYLTPRYNLTDKDIIRKDNDSTPIKVTRADPSTLYNTYSLEWLNRSNYYNAESIYSHDQANQDINAYLSLDWYGLSGPTGYVPRMDSSISAHEIKKSAVAQTVIELIKQRKVSIRNTYEFILPWIFCDLEPMDIVTLTDTEHLQLNAYPVRITSISEDSDSGEYTIQAEDLVYGTNSGSARTQSVSGTVLNTNVAAPAVHVPVIFEPPAALSNNTLQIWVGVSGGPEGVYDSNWGGAEVWCSLDNVDYTYYGKVPAGCRTGSITSAISATDTSLTADMTESNGIIDAGTYTDTNATLIYVDGEFISYGNVTLVSTHVDTLSGLFRGRYGIAASAHATNSKFCCLDSSVGKFDLNASYVGKTIYVKLQSYNIYGQGIQDLGTCAVYTYKVNGSGSTNTLLNALLNDSNIDLGEDDSGYSSMLDLGSDLDLVSNTFDLGEDS